MTKSTGIDSVIATRKIIVTCGTGGVGKTTLSASIAVRAALQGKRVVVITIDPAKRLATSLGMEGKIGDTPTDLSSLLGSDVRGTLHALMPDSEKTFETFFTRLASDAVATQKILRNPIFQIFSKEFSGANEYMALEKLHSLYEQGEYDLIVLDTPPSRNTLSFLDAPRLLAQLFEEKLIRWLVLPANKLVSAGMRKALSVLEKLTGAGFITHLLDFAASLFEMRVRFTANFNRLTALLQSSEVGFLMVTNCAPDLAPEVEKFIDTLREHRLHFDGIMINRTLGHLQKSAHTTSGSLLIEQLKAREAKTLADFRARRLPICATLPELSRDVHSLEDLMIVAESFSEMEKSSGEVKYGS